MSTGCQDPHPFDPKSGLFDDDLLNRFVLNKRIVAYRAEFFVNDGTVF